MQFDRLKRREFITLLGGAVSWPSPVHKPGPLSEYPAADIASYAAVFRRGLQEVSAILKGVTVKP
jgi:hypothetical protein